MFCVYQITVNNFAFLFICKHIGRASDASTNPHRASYFSWLQLDLVLSVAWLCWVQLVVFLCSGIAVVFFDSQGISRCSKTLILSSPHLRFNIDLIHDLHFSCVDSFKG